MGQVQSAVVFQKEFFRTDPAYRANAEVWPRRGLAAILFDSEFASTVALRPAASSTKRRSADAKVRFESPAGGLDARGGAFRRTPAQPVNSGHH
jgi:hypothetical protein